MKIEAAVQRLAPLLVVAVAIGVYLNSLQNGFALDDVYIILDNARVHDLSAWRRIWLTPYWPFFGSELGLYRPFAIFLYAVQWAIGDGATWVFHTGNVLLHALATLLAFLLLDRLTARVPALVGALVFAVHPVHVEAVANVVGQAELITAIALFAACLVHIARPPGVEVSWPRRLALIALFAVGLFTKESAVVLPALLVALDFAQRRVPLTRRGLAHYANHMGMPLLLLAATLASYLIVRLDVLSGALIGVDAAPSMPYLREAHRVLNALRAFPEFVRLLFLPQDLSVDYSPGVVLPVESLTSMALFGAFLLVALTLLALATPWIPAAGLPAAWFLIGIVTVSNLFFPIGVLIAERTLYIPSFAVSLMLAYAWCHAAPRASRAARRLTPVLVVLAVVLLGARTWTRNPDWKSTQQVLKGLVRDHPESYRAQWIQGSVLWERGDFAGAEERYYYAFRIYSRDAEFLLEYGSFLRDLGRMPEAIALMEGAYAMHPGMPRTVATLAHAYLLDGRYATALEFTRKAEEMRADPTTAAALRAWAYHGLGQHQQAVGAWRVAAAKTRFRHWGVQAFLARALVIAGYPEEARAALERGRMVAYDAAGTRKIVQLAAAIEAGCYAHLRAGQAGPQTFLMPACDPLGDFFDLASNASKNASLLQNASAVRVDSTAGESEKRP